MMHAADYVIFTMMLVISLLIGAYHAIKDRNSKKGTEGYLMAGRSLTAIPAGVSIAVTFQSSVAVVGFPNDVYVYGITFIWTLLGLTLTFLVVSCVFIPVLYNLQIWSVYEYLHKRFSKHTRLLSTILYLGTNLLFMGTNIYGPSIALSKASNMNLYLAMTIASMICAFYTALGGLKGVIWADVLQGSVMIMGMLAVIIRGSMMQGGFDQVIDIAREGGRTTVNYSLDPRLRYTFWTMTVGQAINWTGICGTNQSQVQRMLSAKSRAEAIKALAVGLGGVCLYGTLAMLCGLVGYSFFHDCDPQLAHCVHRVDESYPLAVTTIFHGLPGLTGLFLASVYSASLSTVSSGLNSMVTVIMADLVKPHTKWSERTCTWISKVASFGCGCAALGMGMLCSISGDIVRLGIGGMSALIGPSLAVFLLGIFIPFVNGWGATLGIICGYISGMVMFVGSVGLKRPADLTGVLPINSTRCPRDCNFSGGENTTYYSIQPHTNSSGVDALYGIENFYALSVYYTAAVAFFFTLLTAVIASLLTGGWKHRHEIPKDLTMRPFESDIFQKCGMGKTDRPRSNNTEVTAQNNSFSDDENHHIYEEEM